MHSSAFSRAARLVLNHSTHVEKLIPALEVLCKRTQLITTVIPGRLTTASGSTAGLRLKLGVATPTGFKMIARKGTSVQEIFLSTSSSKEEVQAELEGLLPQFIQGVGSSIEGDGRVKRHFAKEGKAELC
jgi:hypothetical protein